MPWNREQKINLGIPVHDEYYTRAEDVAALILRLPDLTDKVVYCPFDSEESEFVKQLRPLCKELKYSCDDYKNHLEEINEADVVISNPPFGILAQILKDITTDYILIIPCLSIKPEEGVYYTGRVSKFNCPDGSIGRVGCTFRSTIPLKPAEKIQHWTWINGRRSFDKSVTAECYSLVDELFYAPVTFLIDLDDRFQDMHATTPRIKGVFKQALIKRVAA